MGKAANGVIKQRIWEGNESDWTGNVEIKTRKTFFFALGETRVAVF